MTSPYLTPPQVAKLFKVSPDTVRLWIGSGRLAATNIAEPGRRPRYRISEGAIATFDKAGKVIAEQPAAAPRRKLAPVPFSRY
jgi:excisionase family DNA binding protein